MLRQREVITKMKLVIKYSGKQWHEKFIAALEIDDKFSELFPEQVLQVEIARALYEVLHDMSNPCLAAMMCNVNSAVLELKNQIIAGMKLSLKVLENSENI